MKISAKTTIDLAQGSGGGYLPTGSEVLIVWIGKKGKLCVLLSEEGLLYRARIENVTILVTGKVKQAFAEMKLTT